MVRCPDCYGSDAQRVLRYANFGAQMFNAEDIGSEHLLLGLVHKERGKALEIDPSVFEVLDSYSIDPLSLRRSVEQRISEGPTMVTLGYLPYTALARRVVYEYALEEARVRGGIEVVPLDLLVGLMVKPLGDSEALRSGQKLLDFEAGSNGIAYDVLTGEFGLRLDDVRAKVRKLYARQLTGEIF